MQPQWFHTRWSDDKVSRIIFSFQLIRQNVARVDMALKGKVHDNKLSVFLGNLHFNTTEEDVRLLFSKVLSI